jgi:hypothetical protein
MVALNVASRDLAGLTRQLDYAQVAAVPFLWGQRLIMDLVGVRDLAVRLLPLVAGCLTLTALRRMASRLLTPIELVTALGLAATSIFLIHYSAEGKPYALDAFVTVLLVGAAAAVLRDATDAHAWRALTLLGILALMVSVPAPLVVGPIAVAVGSVAWEDGTRGRFRLAAAALCWSATFAVAYVATYRAAATMPYMRLYWADAMLSPGPRWGIRWAAGLAEALWPVNYWMVDVGLWWVLLIACVAGVRILLRRHGWRLTLVVVGPCAALLLASMGGRYPMAMRLSLYVSPLLIVLTAVGLVAGVELLRRAVPSVRTEVAIMAILAPTLLVAVAWIVRAPEDQQGIPEILTGLEQARPSEPVYVFHRIAPEWIYFTTDWRNPAVARLAWAARVAGPDGPAFVNAPSMGPRRSGDGAELIDRSANRTELFGAASGIQARAWLAIDPTDLPAWQAVPDSGWAQVEALRVREASRCRAWAVIGTDAPNTGVEDLLRALKAVGGVPQLRASHGNVQLYAIDFGLAGCAGPG